jgi:hypothetical protein
MTPQPAASARTRRSGSDRTGDPVLAAWTADLGDTPVAVDTLQQPTGPGPDRPLGGYALVAGAEGSAVLLDAASGEVAARTSVDGGLLHAAFAPLTGPAPQLPLVGLSGPSGHGVWRPGHPEAPLWWRATGAWSARLRWSAQGRLAVTSGRHIVVEQPRPDGPKGLVEVWRSPRQASTVTDVVWMDAGRRVAAACYGGIGVHRVGVDSAATTYAYVGSHLVVEVPVGERWLVSGNQDATIHVWRRVRTGGDGDELHMSGYPGKVTRLEFDPTGRWLAADGAPEITVWDFAGRGPAGRSARLLAAHDEVTALAWSPARDGLLATGGAEGLVAVWRPAGGAPGKAQRPLAVSEPDTSGDHVEALAWLAPNLLIVGRRSGLIRLLTLPPAPVRGR